MSSLVVWRPRAVWLRPDMPRAEARLQLVRRRGRARARALWHRCSLWSRDQVSASMCSLWFGCSIPGSMDIFLRERSQNVRVPDLFLVELWSSGFVNPGELQMFCNNLQPPPARKRTRTTESTPPILKRLDSPNVHRAAPRIQQISGT